MVVEYSSKTGKESGVFSYEMGEDYIVLNYKNKNGDLKSISYSYEVSGKHHVEQIKKFAQHSKNLNTYLSENRIRCRKLSEA